MTKEEILEKIEELLQKHDIAGIREACSHLEPIDLAEMLAEVPQETQVMLFRILPKDTAADTFAEMEPEEQQRLLGNFTDQEVKDVLAEMGTDDAVDMLRL